MRCREKGNRIRDELRLQARLLRGPDLNVRLLRGHTLCIGMIFILPVLYPYYRDVLGLSFRDFMITEAFFSATMIIMEVPSGWLSDVWTRRKTLIMGTLVHILGFGMLLMADGLALAILAQATLGVSVSLISGTNTALLYDSLQDMGRTAAFRAEEGKRHAYSLYAVCGSCLTGGFMYALDPHLPIIAILVANAVGLAFAALMTEPHHHKEAATKHPLADMVDTARYALHGHAGIGGLILMAACLFGTTKMLLWLQQPYYELLVLDMQWYGILAAGGFLLGGLGAHFGHRIDGRFSHMGVLLACIGFVFCAGLINGLWPGHYGIILLLGGSLIYGFGFPRVQDAINQQVDSSRRATIISTASLMVHVVAVPSLVLIGTVSDRNGVTAALLTLSTVMGVMGAVTALGRWLKHRARRARQGAPLAPTPEAGTALAVAAEGSVETVTVVNSDPL